MQIIIVTPFLHIIPEKFMYIYESVVYLHILCLKIFSAINKQTNKQMKQTYIHTHTHTHARTYARKHTRHTHTRVSHKVRGLVL